MKPINKKQFDFICKSELTFQGETIGSDRKSAAYEVIISRKDILFAGADNGVNQSQLEDDIAAITRAIYFYSSLAKLGK